MQTEIKEREGYSYRRRHKRVDISSLPIVYTACYNGAMNMAAMRS